MFNRKMQLSKINDGYKCKVFELMCNYSSTYDMYFTSGVDGFSIMAYDKSDPEKSYKIIKYVDGILKIHTLVSIMINSRDFYKIFDYIKKTGIMLNKVPLDHLIKLAVASKLV